MLKRYHWQFSAIICGDLQAPDNGYYMSSGVAFGDNVTYGCHAGFNLTHASSIRTCQANRTWSGMQPNCAS